MEPNGVAALAKSPPQEGPYSVRKQQCIHSLNSGHRGTTPGGSFIDRMRTVLHKAAAAGSSADKTSARKSSSSHDSAWGDTPDTEEMECIAQMERAALRQRLENFTGLEAPAAAAVGNENAGQQAAPTASAGPRQLMFSPVIDTDPLSGKTSLARPGSGRLRSTQRRQLSNLGRISLAPSVAVAAENQPLPTTLQQSQTEIINQNNNDLLNRPSVSAVRPPEVFSKETSGAVKRQKVENNLKVARKDPKVVNNSGFDGAHEFLDSSDDDEDQEGRPVEGATTSTCAVAAAAAITAPPPAPAPPLELREYLSQDVAEAILRIGGPETLYQWQAECLCRPGILQVSMRLEETLLPKMQFLLNLTF